MKDITRIVDFILTTKCNLNCYYCLQGNEERVSKCDSIDIASIKKIDGINLFHLTGGEPFVVPNFIEICNNLLSRGQYLSLNTNLTIPVEKFIANVEPKNILFINASVHYYYRKEHMNPFIRNYNAVRLAGFFIYATVVMVPEQFDEIVQFIEKYQADGMILFPKLMRGQSGGKLYPKSYTAEQLEKLNNLVQAAKKQMSKSEMRRFAQVCGNNISIDDWWGGENKLVGTRCFDGYKYIRITEVGDIVYCNNIKIGNIYIDGIKSLSAPKECSYLCNNICLKAL